MGWTDIVGASHKVGRLIRDTSLSLRISSRQNQDHDAEFEERPGTPSFSCTPPDDDFPGGPDTSSLSAFIYSFLSSPTQADLQRREELRRNADLSEEDNFEDAPSRLDPPDWCVVSSCELESSIMEDYIAKPFKLPEMSDPSSLLSESYRQALYPLLPTIVKDCQWVLLYSTARHGISLMTLYRRSALVSGPCLLVAGDTKGAVFGGLLLAPLKATKKFQGSNQTFVFSNVSGKLKVFRPTGLNRYFFLCTNEALAVGGGGHFALHLDSDLLSGSSGACETFGNDCLAHSDEFQLKDVELWGFVYNSKYRR